MHRVFSHPRPTEVVAGSAANAACAPRASPAAGSETAVVVAFPLRPLLVASSVADVAAFASAVAKFVANATNGRLSVVGPSSEPRPAFAP